MTGSGNNPRGLRLAAGTLLRDRYKILRRIGGGGMGSVYLAEDAVFKRLIAVKEMVEMFAVDAAREKAIADFQREAELLAHLDHQAIPTIFDYFFDESRGRYYLVMKYIDGGDLASRMQALGGKVDEYMVAQWGVEICDVLDYIHSQNPPIIYRDLKPANLMLDTRNRIMLVDFGIARVVAPMQKGVTAIGTMGYAPPELFAGHVGPASDIYSLGATMFHLLTGHDPQNNPLLIFDFTKNPKPRQINPDISAEMEALIMKAVEYKPESRYTTARAFGKELKKHLRNGTRGEQAEDPSEVVEPPLAAEVWHCAQCGHEMSIDDIFCAFCGEKQIQRQTAKLIVVGTNEISAQFTLNDDGEMLIGRTDPNRGIRPTIDLSNFDPAARISRKHAKIIAQGNQFFIEDLGSSNGTFYNGQIRLPQGKQHALANGDEVRLGDTTLKFIFVESSGVSDRVFTGGVGAKPVTGAMPSQRRETTLGSPPVERPTVRPPASVGTAREFPPPGAKPTDAEPPSKLPSIIGSIVDRLFRKTGAVPRITDPQSPLPSVSAETVDRSQKDKSTRSIRRYTDLSFPSKVKLGKLYNLRLRIVPAEEVTPSGEIKPLPKPHDHDIAVSLVVPQPREDEPPPPIRIAVSVTAENFEIEGDNQAIIEIPLAGKSEAINFRLRGIEIGAGRVMIDFAQDGRPVGSVDLVSEVVGVDAVESLVAAAGSGEVSISTSTRTAPDLVIKVFEFRFAGEPGRLHFVASSSKSELRDLPVMDGDLGTIDLRADIANWVAEQLQTLDSLARRDDLESSEVARTLADLGNQLFDQLVPPRLKELCWTFRARGVRSVLILSDEPHIPWEMIKPYRIDEATGNFEREDEFWGESYALTHWLRGRPPVENLSLQRIATMTASGFGSGVRDFAPAAVEINSKNNAPLRAVDRELSIIRSLNRPVEMLPARRKVLQHQFEQGDFDLLHLAAHGAFGGSTMADASAILLEDGSFSVGELAPRVAGAIRRTSPLIFFNACHSGRLGFSLTRLGSWGARLVELGCGAFIGTLWPVTDEAAVAFAEAFYRRLISGAPIGEAVCQARHAVRDRYPNDPTWMAYCCYADPLAKMI